VERAARLVFTTGKARDHYLAHYPGLAEAAVSVIENGFEAAAFPEQPEPRSVQDSSKHEELLVLHSGALYGEGRNPGTLIGAASIVGERLAAEGRRLILRFRGVEPTPELMESVKSCDAERYVDFAPRVPFAEAQREMAAAKVLVVIQSALFDLQIPGKVYEYIAARRPILAVTSKDGATAALLEQVESALSVADGDVAAVADALLRAIAMDGRSGDISRFERGHGAERLGRLLSAVAGPR